MKKILSLLMIFSLIFTGCNKSSNEIVYEENTVTVEPVKPIEPNDETQKSFNIATLNGPTAIGFLNMMDESDNTFSILQTPDEAVAKIVNGEVDIASVPSNLASILYNKTNGEIVVAAINTLGVLYVVENSDEINSISDLKGKTIYSTGKGATPEYAFNYILEKAGIDDVTVEYKTQHSELAALLSEKKANLAVLPEPFVTTALSNNPDLKVALDLNEEWEKLDTTSTMITGVLVARKSVIEENKEDFDNFLKSYEQSIEKTKTNLETTAKLAEKYNILTEDIALKAIPKCNITYIDGQEMQNLLSNYLNILYSQNPQSIGAVLPDEQFYYKK